MLDTTGHSRRRARRMADPAYRQEYEQARAEIEQIDAVIRALDEMRESQGMSKAELARRINRNDAVVRRMFTAEVNPELRLVVEVATALGGRLEIVRDARSPKSRRRQLAADSA